MRIFDKYMDRYFVEDCAGRMTLFGSVSCRCYSNKGRDYTLERRRRRHDYCDCRCYFIWRDVFGLKPGFRVLFYHESVFVLEDLVFTFTAFRTLAS